MTDVLFVADVAEEVAVFEIRQHDQRQLVLVKGHSDELEDVSMIELPHAQSFVEESSTFQRTGGVRAQTICMKTWLVNKRCHKIAF